MPRWTLVHVNVLETPKLGRTSEWWNVLLSSDHRVQFESAAYAVPTLGRLGAVLCFT